MKGTIVSVSTTIFVAFAILLVSLFKSVGTQLAYSPMVLSEKTESEKVKTIDYVLAYPGKIGPDSPVWYPKVIRDKAWYIVTFNPCKKSELNLLFSDKRLSSSLELFKKNKPDLGLSTSTKSVKYLESAESVLGDSNNPEYSELYKKIALSSLKHKEVIELEILPITPEDLRPEVIKTGNYSIEVYKKTRDHMLGIGQIPPGNIFETK